MPQLAVSILVGLFILFIILFAYFILYITSYIYLKPYMPLYMEYINELKSRLCTINHTPLMSKALLVVYLTAPFNAYEALIINTNIYRYFSKTVLIPTLFAFLALIPTLPPQYFQARSADLIKRGFKLGLLIVLGGLFSTWLTSFTYWIFTGIPSFGTSVYFIFQIAVLTYSLIMLLNMLAEGKVNKKNMIAILILLALVYVIPLVIFLSYLIPQLWNPNHVVGIIYSIFIILIYHLTRIKL